MKELVGGLWLAGLVCWAVLGLIPSIALFILGGIAGSWELVKELQAEKNSISWRKHYPPYGY